ncbi:MAG TPA: 2-dehydropantoate 2-reductase [Ktedonobacterales bacterium]
MRIAIQGAGAMGTYFGGLLARAGEDVTMLARGATVEALRARGLTVKSLRLGEFTVPVTALDAAVVSAGSEHLDPVDVVLFCVKTYDTRTAAEGIRRLVGPDTTVISVQNGVESAERIAEVIGSKALLGGVAQVSALLEAPGVVVARTDPATLRFGELSGGLSARTERLAPVFAHAGIVAEPQTDMVRAIWEKFLFICAVSGVTALTRLPLGPLLAHEETRSLLRGTLDEVATVARAQGIELGEDAEDGVFTLLGRFSPQTQGSMADDLAAGKRLELDALNGAVVRMGQRLGVATPINRVITAALTPFRDGAPALFS